MEQPGTAVRNALFPRSRPTVGAKVKCSIGVQLCVLPMRPETVDAVLIIATDANHTCFAWVAQLHVCRQLGYLDTPQ
jgi:hypothetical protein